MYKTNNEIRTDIDRLRGEAKAERNSSSMRPIEHESRLASAELYELQANDLERELELRYAAIPDNAGKGKNPNEPDILRAWQEYR